MILQVSENLEFTKGLVVSCFRLDVRCLHQQPARNMKGSLELVRNPGVAQGDRQCDMHRPQAIVPNQAVEIKRKLFYSFHIPSDFEPVQFFTETKLRYREM